MSSTTSEQFPPPKSEYFFERYPWNHKWVLFSVAVIVSCFDFMAVEIVFFPILFLIPLMLLAWNCGLRTALKLGAVLCVIRFSIQYSWGIPYPAPVAVINAVLRLLVAFLLTFLCAKLSEQTHALRARVRTLEGILPTCCFCKDIRDGEGNWHQIEEYVGSRSAARFSHGVCPKCAEEHYGDLLARQRNREETPVA